MSLGSFWGVAAVILPLFARVSSVSAVSQRFSKDTFFVFLIITSLSLFGINEVKKETKYFGLTVIVLAFFNQSNFASIATLYQFAMIAGGVLLFLQLSTVSYKNTLKIKQGLAISCIIQSLLVAFSYLGIDIYRSVVEIVFSAQTYNPTRTAIAEVNTALGSFTNRNTAGAFIACTIPFLLNRKFKYFLPLAIASLLGTNSTMPVISLVIGIPVYILTLSKGVKFAALSILVVLAFSIYALISIDSGFFSNSGRLPSWLMVLNYLKSNFSLFGQGPGFVYDNYALFSNSSIKFRQLHNEYLELLVGYGAVGAALFLVAINKIFSNLTNMENDSGISFFIICANAFGFFNIHISSIAMVLILSCAIILRGKDVEKLES